RPTKPISPMSGGRPTDSEPPRRSRGGLSGRLPKARGEQDSCLDMAAPGRLQAHLPVRVLRGTHSAIWWRADFALVSACRAHEVSCADLHKDLRATSALARPRTLQARLE